MNKYKVCLLGASEVGKTSIVNRLMKRKFNIYEPNTIGSAFSKYVDIYDKKEYNIEIWDTCGQEKYASLTKIFYNKSDVILFVFDINNKGTWIKLKEKVVEILHDYRYNNNISILILGNKIDIITDNEIIYDYIDKINELINKYSKDFNISSLNNTKPDKDKKYIYVDYLFVSAKTKKNIPNILKHIRKYCINFDSNNLLNKNKIIIDEYNKQEEYGYCCY